MSLIEIFAGVAFLLGDFISTIAIGCSLLIAGAAFINLGSDLPFDVPANIYVTWILLVIVSIGGQIAISMSNLHPFTSGILGLPPNYPLFTIICAIILFIISRFLRKNKYC